MDLGTVLRHAREAACLSQDDVARMSGTRQSMISRYECGSVSIPWPTFEGLLAALGLEPEVRLVPLHGLIDAAIDELAALPVAARIDARGLRVRRSLSAFAEHVERWALTGSIAALLQGVPVPVQVVEILVVDDDANLQGVARALRGSLVVFRDLPVRDAREMADMVHWPGAETDIVFRLVEALPVTIPLMLGDLRLPVVPLPDLDLDDPVVRRALERVTHHARPGGPGLGLAHD